MMRSATTELGGKQSRALTRNDDGMLMVGCERTIPGADSPAIPEGYASWTAHGDERLDGENQSFCEHMGAAGIVVVGDCGRFMDGPPDTVSGQIANHRVAGARHGPVNRSSDVEGFRTRTNLRHPVAKGLPSAID